MRLEILVGGRTRLLEIDPWTLEFSVDGRAGKADAVRVEPGVYSILLEGHSYEVKLESGPQGLYTSVNGWRFEMEVRDPRRLARGGARLEAAGRQRICSPMPGKVLRILKREGDTVSAGEGLLVVEAMKMQNEVRSPKSGRVAAVRVVEGATVAAGQTLLEVE